MRAKSLGLAAFGALLLGCSGGTDPSYADGEYTAKGWYGGQPSSIDVTITLLEDVVVDVEVIPNATDPTSLELQERFAEAVPAVVVGRDLADLEVDKLAGSSGTPDGFNDALEQIRAQAVD